MGAISQLVQGKTSLSQETKAHGFAREAVERGRSLWRNSFGQAKEESLSKFPRVRDRQSWTRGVIAEPAAYKRLLQAMRSMAPGGWSDDRFEESRHENGIVYTAIHRKGEQLSMSKFQVFKKDHRIPGGKRPITPDDPPEGGRPQPPYKLVELLESPNNDDSWGTIMYWWQQQMDLTGTALTWMVPNRLGIPHELYVVPTAIAIPQPAINPDYPDGYYRIQPIYPYGPFSSYPTPATAVGAPIPAQWMLRFKYPHPLLRYDGFSPLTPLKLHVDEIEAMDRARWYSSQRLINPSGILNMEAIEGMEALPEAEIERIRADFEADFQGPENSGRLFVAAPGSKLEIQQARLHDLEFRDGWEQLVSFVLGAGYGISKEAAGMLSTASYSTLFATLKQMHLLTLDPFCHRIADYLTKHLAPFFGDDLIIEIKAPRIDDHDLKNAMLTLLMQAKGITKNEMRQELNMPITQEKWGEEIAGTESQQQGMLPGLGGAPGGMPGMEAPGAPGMPAPGQGLPPGVKAEPYAPALGQGGLENTRANPPEVFNSRPQPGKHGAIGLRGAMGPRKNMEHKTKGIRNSPFGKRFEKTDEQKEKELELLREAKALTPTEEVVLAPGKIYRKSFAAELDRELSNGHH